MKISHESCTRFMEWVNENRKAKTQSFDAHINENKGKSTLVLTLDTDSPFKYQFVFDIVKEEDPYPYKEEG